MAELHAQNRALDALKTHVIALEDVLIFLFATPVSQHAKRASVLVTRCHGHSAFAISAEIFAGIEAEAANVPQAPDSTPFVFRAVCLCSILDNQKIMLA